MKNLVMKGYTSVRTSTLFTSTKSPKILSSFRDNIIVKFHNDPSFKFSSYAYVQITSWSCHSSLLFLSPSLVFSVNKYSKKKKVCEDEKPQNSPAIYIFFENLEAVLNIQKRLSSVSPIRKKRNTNKTKKKYRGRVIFDEIKKEAVLEKTLLSSFHFIYDKFCLLTKFFLFAIFFSHCVIF